MARKSRKINQTTTESTQIPNLNTTFKTAIYIRLSVNDSYNNSLSIENQNCIIGNYIEENTEFEVFDIYIDNGFSGQTLKRPAFLRMLEDIESDKVNAVICKDMSRLSRNSLYSAYYIEKYFPLNNVRFVSVTEQFDSFKNTPATLNLKFLINEMYSLDISKKIKATYKQNMKDGKFIASRPPYGYKKDEKNIHQLIIDEESSEIVKQIFLLASERKGLSHICRILNSQKSITPSRHIEKFYPNNNFKKTDKWNTIAVTRILKSEVYIGNLVQGKISGNIYRRENTHDAIISKELFEQVQIIRKEMSEKYDVSNSIGINKDKPNIFIGKLFCGDCGEVLQRKDTQRVGEQIFAFKCNSNQIIKNNHCSNSSLLLEPKLIEVVQNSLAQQFDLILSENVHFKKRENFLNQELIKIDKELVTLNKDVNNADKYQKTLYESLVGQLITIDEYKLFKANYSSKIDTFEQNIETLTLDKAKIELEIKELNKIAKITSNKNLKLDREILDNFIESIHVWNDGKIEIKFNFSFELSKELEVMSIE